MQFYRTSTVGPPYLHRIPKVSNFKIFPFFAFHLSSFFFLKIASNPSLILPPNPSSVHLRHSPNTPPTHSQHLPNTLPIHLKTLPNSPRTPLNSLSTLSFSHPSRSPNTPFSSFFPPQSEKFFTNSLLTINYLSKNLQKSLKKIPQPFAYIRKRQYLCTRFWEMKVFIPFPLTSVYFSSLFACCTIRD